MDENEYEKFMANLYDKYVQPADQGLMKLFKRLIWRFRLFWVQKRIKRTINLLNSINKYIDDIDDEEVYNIISENELIKLLRDVRYGVIKNKQMLKKSGFLYAINYNYDQIVDGMKLEHMPLQELQIMHELGITNPKAELTESIHIVKSSCKKRHESDLKIDYNNHIEEKFDELIKELKKPKEPSKRRFKGLGKITQGSVLIIADIGLFMGAITVPASVETAGWGTIVSTATGIGMVGSGMGDWKGEGG